MHVRELEVPLQFIGEKVRHVIRLPLTGVGRKTVIVELPDFVFDMRTVKTGKVLFQS